MALSTSHRNHFGSWFITAIVCMEFNRRKQFPYGVPANFWQKPRRPESGLLFVYPMNFVDNEYGRVFTGTPRSDHTQLLYTADGAKAWTAEVPRSRT